MLIAGTLLHDRYRIGEPLGQGGMGAVYLAIDEKFGSTVALKETLVEGVDLRKAFEREARLLNVLRHRALPVVMDYFSESGGLFLVMQYIPGDDLGALLAAQDGPFAPDLVLDWADQLLEALTYLHEHDPQIVHRDLKPRNLKLTPQGEVILLDFGLSKSAPSAAMAANASVSVLGYTPRYAPFEQIHGTGTDPRSDLFSLGATLYHFLTGILPPDVVARAEHTMNGEPDPLQRADRVNPAIAAPVAALVHQAMAMSREQRPPSAAAMRTALRAAREEGRLPGAETTVLPPPPVTRSLGRPWRRPFAAVAATAIAAIAVLAVWSWTSRETPEMATPAAASATTEAELITVPPAERTFSFDSVTLTAKGATKDRRALLGRSYEEDMGNGVAIEMVAIPAGSFLMGAPDAAATDYADERPQHPVTVASFYMSKYEVTQAQWRAIATSVPAVQRQLVPDPSEFKGDDLPVENVSWEDVVEFANRFTRKARRDYRLPSEAEWEYAARAGTTTAFAFGDAITAEVVNYDARVPSGAAAAGTRRGRTVSVGSLGVANAFGLYDMHGNVSEWCLGEYHDSYVGAPEDGRPWMVGGDIERHIVRGGSWNDLAVDCRSANRYSYVQQGKRSTIGFRLAMSMRPVTMVSVAR